MKAEKKPGLYVAGVLIVALVPGIAAAGAYFTFGESQVLLTAVAIVVTLILASGFCWAELFTRVDLDDTSISVTTPLSRKTWVIPQDIKGISDFGTDYMMEFSNSSGIFEFRSGAFKRNGATRILDDIVEKIRNEKLA